MSSSKRLFTDDHNNIKGLLQHQAQCLLVLTISLHSSYLDVVTIPAYFYNSRVVRALERLDVGAAGGAAAAEPRAERLRHHQLQRHDLQLPGCEF